MMKAVFLNIAQTHCLPQLSWPFVVLVLHTYKQLILFDNFHFLQCRATVFHATPPLLLQTHSRYYQYFFWENSRQLFSAVKTFSLLQFLLCPLTLLPLFNNKYIASDTFKSFISLWCEYACLHAFHRQTLEQPSSVCIFSTLGLKTFQEGSVKTFLHPKLTSLLDYPSVYF